MYDFIFIAVYPYKQRPLAVNSAHTGSEFSIGRECCSQYDLIVAATRIKVGQHIACRIEGDQFAV